MYDFVVEGGSLPVSVIQEESDPAELYYSLLFECPTTCNGKGFSICHERPFEILLLKYLVVQLLQLVVIHRFYLNERLLLCMHCCMHGKVYKKAEWNFILVTTIMISTIMDHIPV